MRHLGVERHLGQVVQAVFNDLLVYLRTKSALNLVDRHKALDSEPKGYLQLVVDAVYRFLKAVGFFDGVWALRRLALILHGQGFSAAEALSFTT